MPVECFWVEPLPIVQRSLRRYLSVTGDKRVPCPLMPGEWSYHDVSVVIVDELPKAIVNPEVSPTAEALNDPRMPTACRCGYVFPTRRIYSSTNAGAYTEPISQVNDDRYFARSAGPGIAPAGGAERWVYHCALGLPPGAMLRTWWLEPRFVGTDGMSIGVMLPSGMLWPIDFPPSDNPNARWARTGVPPKITASPSINHVDHYHGFLQNGVLT